MHLVMCPPELWFSIDVFDWNSIKGLMFLFVAVYRGSDAVNI
jgi:hypothetical protein